jgi:pimeloyl-ACP methyl ester carboxylesterase
VPPETPRIPPGAAGRHVLVGGTPIRYVQAGTGPDVVLVHGSPGSVEDWEPILPRLSPRFRVTAFDRPGHGYSGGADRPHTAAENATAALDLIRALGLHDAVLVGHSFGGAIALDLAIRRPPEVRSYVLVGAKAYPPVPVEPVYRAVTLPLVGRGLATALTPLMGQSRIDAGVRESFRPNADAMPAGFVARRQPIWTKPAVIEALSEERVGYGEALATMAPHYGEIRPPVVIVCGDEDHNRDDAVRLGREIPGARLVILPHTGHYVQFARPDELAALIEGAR